MSQNIKPSVWGPHGWKFMHYVSLGYPVNPSQEDKQHYKNFYESLQYILPCKTCSKNYSKNLKDHPIDSSLSSQGDLIKWVIDIHNKVNKEIHKPILGYEEADDLYLKQRSNLLDYGYKLLVLCFILCIIYFTMKYLSF
jgi:hypothetical protein